MTNRVEELEGQVAELRAAINGLTEELVETKSRVKDLEDAAEAEAAAPEPEPELEPETGVVETTTVSDDHVEVVTHERRETEITTDDNAADADESASADSTPEGDAPAESAETTAASAADTTAADHTDEADQSEIIVA